MANYCTLNELKQSMRITDNVDNSLLTAAIESASIWVDGWCDRDFTVAGTATSRDYIPTGTYDVLQIDDATEVVSVKIDDDLDRTFSVTLLAIDFQTEPLNDTVGGLRVPIMRLRPFEDGYWPTWKNQATVRVEARYGWPAVPASVKQATILQSSAVFTRLDSPLGVAGFGDMGAMRVSRFVDPHVEMLLAPYRRVRY